MSALSISSARATTQTDPSRLARYLSRASANEPYLTWQLEQFAPYLGRRILEVGCGIGGIIEQLGARELIWGIDVEPDVLEYARTRFCERPECRFELLNLTDCSPEWLSDLQAQEFDTVVCINTLEHIVDDHLALTRMRDILRPGGVVALLVPSHPALFGAYDQLDGHIRRYTLEGLRTLALQAGLSIVALRHFNALGAIGWWMHYRLLRKQTHGASQFRTMGRLIPYCRAIERSCAPPFGLSLVAILQKRETEL